MAVNILFDILGIPFPRNPDRWSEIWFPVSGSKRSSRTLHGIYHTSTIDTYQLEILSVSFLLYSHLVAVSWVGIAICWKFFGWCNQLWCLKTLVNQLWCLKTYKANGGFIMSASHNPGGPENDWGIKFNYSSGQPAPESITDKIYGNTLSISEIKMADISDVDLSRLGVTNFGGFTVEVVDPVSDYMELLESVFDFELIRTFITRPDFRFKFDAMHAITGAYAKPIFVDQLGANADSISNGI